MNYQEGRNFEILNEEESWRIVWIHNNAIHNDSGPAIEYAHGTKLWYLFGIQVSEKDVEIFNSKKQLNQKLQENLADKNKEKNKKI